METNAVSDLIQQEHIRWAERINREAWKFEQIEQPARGRLNVATLRQRFRR